MHKSTLLALPMLLAALLLARHASAGTLKSDREPARHEPPSSPGHAPIAAAPRARRALRPPAHVCRTPRPRTASATNPSTPPILHVWPPTWL